MDPSILDKAYDFVKVFLSKNTSLVINLIFLFLFKNFLKGMDPNRPISEVFCCVDPAKYIDSFDIGMWYIAHINKLFRTKQDHFIASTLLFFFTGMADPYPIPNSSPFYVGSV